MRIIFIKIYTYMPEWIFVQNVVKLVIVDG